MNSREVVNSWMVWSCWPICNALRWRHTGHDGVSNHQPHDSLLNRFFRHRSKKTSKLRVTGLCAGNSPVTGEFHALRVSNAENISIWWRHPETLYLRLGDISASPMRNRHLTSDTKYIVVWSMLFPSTKKKLQGKLHWLIFVFIARFSCTAMDVYTACWFQNCPKVIYSRYYDREFCQTLLYYEYNSSTLGFVKHASTVLRYQDDFIFTTAACQSYCLRYTSRYRI